MSQLRNRLRMLMILVMALALAVSAVPVSGLFVRSTAAAETLEVVSSYPYDTTTKVSVNLRARKSTRSTLVKKIPAGAEITVEAVSGSWATVKYGRYSGYVKTDYIVLKEVKKIKVTPTPTPVATLSPEENAGGYQILQKGDSGDAVISLQEALIELGFMTGKADGNFGSGTQQAVIAFQQKNDYPDTGIMDANIQAFLYTGTVKNARGEKVTIKTLSPVEGVSMKKGNTGHAVTELQTRLMALGYLKKASGTYDTDTIGAVRSFQKKNGIASNGTADADTRKAIFSDSAIGANTVITPTPKVTATPTPVPTVKIPAVTLKSGSKGEDVKTLQTRLKELGYYTSNIDGKMGRGTVSALKAFQKAHGLTDDGVAGQSTYAILFSENALKKGTTPTPAPTATPVIVGNETAAPTATATATATDDATLWPTMRKNDSGQNVAQLQEMLIQLGYLSGTADGNYGTDTEKAVKAFQKANGLTQDGTAGPATQKKLFGGSAKAAPTPTPSPTPKATKAGATPTPAPASSSVLKVGSKGDEVKSLQQKLIELGYLRGTADGIFGNKTAAAVKAFQTASKLTADGIAGRKTLSKLNSTSSSNTSSSSSSSSSSSANTGIQTSVRPSASKVQYANWYDKVKAIARKYPYATVYDFATGISWQIHIFSIGAHADYEPVTANDTAKLLKAFGGNTWNPRAVWVVFSDGSVYLGSTHSMPHEVQHNRDNNFEGHSCLHFPRTQAQVEAIGPYATKHQEIIDAGWAATQKMQ